MTWSFYRKRNWDTYSSWFLIFCSAFAAVIMWIFFIFRIEGITIKNTGIFFLANIFSFLFLVCVGSIVCHYFRYKRFVKDGVKKTFKVSAGIRVSNDRILLLLMNEVEVFKCSIHVEKMEREYYLKKKEGDSILVLFNEKMHRVIPIEL